VIVLIDWELRLEIRKRSAKCSRSTRDAVRYILTVAELIIDPVRLRCAVLAVNILAVDFVGHTAMPRAFFCSARNRDLACHIIAMQFCRPLGTWWEVRVVKVENTLIHKHHDQENLIGNYATTTRSIDKQTIFQRSSGYREHIHTNIMIPEMWEQQSGILTNMVIGAMIFGPTSAN
jgi:hypothetical protein